MTVLKKYTHKMLFVIKLKELHLANLKNAKDFLGTFNFGGRGGEVPCPERTFY
jgi:hypothetical protein